MDGLSSAASVIAILQLADNVKNLYAFWDSVREAPENFRCIATDLSLLSTVLADIAHDAQHTLPDHTMIAVLNGCSEKVRQLSSFVEKFEPGFTSSNSSLRKWSALKATFKSNRLKQIQSSLESLKATLLLVQSKCQSHLNRIRYEAHQQNLTTITRDISSFRIHQPFEGSGAMSDTSINASERRNVQIIETVDVCSSRPDSSVYSLEKPFKGIKGTRQATLARRHASSKYWCKAYYSSFGTIIHWKMSKLSHALAVTYAEKTEKSDKLEVDSSSLDMICFLPSAWLSSYGYNFRSEKCNDLSTRSLSTFHIVPFSSPVFGLAKMGQLNEVKTLFREHKASAFDVDPNGYTLLHYAAAGLQLECCQYLVDLGLNADAVGVCDNQWDFVVQKSIHTPLLLALYSVKDYFAWQRRPQDCDRDCSSSNIVNIVRLLVSSGADPMFPREDGGTALHIYYGPAEPYTWLLQQDTFVIDLDFRSSYGSTIITEQLLREGQYGRELCPDGEVFRSIPIRPADATTIAIDGTSFTHLQVAVISFVMGFSSRKSLDVLRASIIGLIKAGADVHAWVGFNKVFPTHLGLLMRSSIGYEKLDLEGLANIVGYSTCSHCAVKQQLRDPPLTEWLQILFEAGIDLAQYGQVEESLLKERGGRVYPFLTDWPFIYRTLTFSYGSGALGLEIESEDHWVEDIPGGECFCYDDLGRRLTPEEIKKATKAFDAEKRSMKLEKDLEMVKVPGSWD